MAWQKARLFNVSAPWTREFRIRCLSVMTPSARWLFGLTLKRQQQLATASCAPSPWLVRRLMRL